MCVVKQIDVNSIFTFGIRLVMINQVSHTECKKGLSTKFVHFKQFFLNFKAVLDFLRQVSYLQLSYKLQSKLFTIRVLNCLYCFLFIYFIKGVTHRPHKSSSPPERKSRFYLLVLKQPSFFVSLFHRYVTFQVLVSFQTPSQSLPLVTVFIRLTALGAY